MKYILLFFLLILSIYPLSYAKYNWDKKNKSGAVGCVFLAVAAVVMPSVILWVRM